MAERNGDKMTPIMTIKNGKGLLPCPFCGSDDINRIITTSHCEVICHHCKAKIIRGLFLGKYDCLEDAENDFGKEADKAWNTRTQKEVGRSELRYFI